MHHLSRNKWCNKVVWRNILIAAVLATLPQIGMAEDTMPEVAVKASATKETAHSGTEGYVANRTTTATKTDAPIIETPQSIYVVTNQ